MSDVDVTLRLPEELVEKARAQGVLNDKRIALLLEAEIERMEGWKSLDQSLEAARESFRATQADEAQRLADYCRTHLALEDIQIGDEYAYASLPLCVVDAIFSINANYNSTRNTVDRIKAYFGDTSSFTIRDLVELYQEHSVDFIASEVFKNRQRTSTRNGILKAEAVLRVAETLLKYGVNDLRDMKAVIKKAAFESDYKMIPGQASGISLRYLYMLTGLVTEIKPDRMVIRFIEAAIRRSVSVDECHPLVVSACELLKSENPDLSPRDLDNAIWQFQRLQ
jgi:hypothetical protein